MGTMFSGKILIEHLANFSPMLSKTIDKLLGRFEETNKVNISIDRFGMSRVVRAGALFGALSKESRSALTSRIEELCLQYSSSSIPVIVSREKLFEEDTGSPDTPQFAWTTFIKCWAKDVETLSVSLQVIFGKNSPDSDPLRPLLRFIPIDLLTASHITRTKFIHEKKALDESITTLTMKNIRPLETLLPIPAPSTEHDTISTISPLRFIYLD